MTPTQILFAIVAQFLGLGYAFGKAIQMTRRKQSLLWGTLAGYGLMLVWGLIFCLIAPMTLQYVTGNDAVWRHFPDPAGAVGLLFLGWWPFLLVCGLTRLHQRTTTRRSDLRNSTS